MAVRGPRAVSIHLVDGTYELFRCFHGAPGATNDGGEEVGAGRGLIETLAALLRVEGATHVAVAFDSVGLARSGADSAVAAQVPLAVEVCRALGLVVWPAARWSADDVLASAATVYGALPAGEVERIAICSADLDFHQCVRGERVVAVNRSRRTVTDEPAVISRYGVPPQVLPDFFALTGDRSDGVAGVPGWGSRSAGIVLARWGSIEAVPEDPARWEVSVRGAARLADALAADREEALFARDLLRLNTELPIRTTVEGLAWRGPDLARLGAVCARLGIDEPPTLPSHTGTDPTSDR